jgi:hypothetical protein
MASYLKNHAKMVFYKRKKEKKKEKKKKKNKERREAKMDTQPTFAR